MSVLNNVLSSAGGLLGGSLGGLGLDALGLACPEAAIALSVAKMFAPILAPVVKDAVRDLAQQAGLPQPVADMLCAQVDQAVGALQQQQGPSDPDVDRAVQDRWGGDPAQDYARRFSHDLAVDMLDRLRGDDVRDHRGNGDGEGGVVVRDHRSDCGGTGGGDWGGTGGSGGADDDGPLSWFEAVAFALGDALRDQANEIKKLADNISVTKMEDDPKAFMKLQAAVQRMNMMETSSDNAVKTLGESNAKLGGRN